MLRLIFAGVALVLLADPEVLVDAGTVERWGRTFRLMSYRLPERNIWGATARMIHELLELMA